MKRSHLTHITIRHPSSSSRSFWYRLVLWVSEGFCFSFFFIRLGPAVYSLCKCVWYTRSIAIFPEKRRKKNIIFFIYKYGNMYVRQHDLVIYSLENVSSFTEWTREEQQIHINKMIHKYKMKLCIQKWCFSSLDGWKLVSSCVSVSCYSHFDSYTMLQRINMDDVLLYHQH